jgi:hypothetical protein
MKCFSLNSTVKLRVLFYNDCKEATNVDNITLTVTKPDGNTEVFDDNNHTFVNVDTGYYYYSYTGTDLEGEYKHLWNVTIDGAVVSKEDSFEVKGGGSVDFKFIELDKNELIVIELLSSIEAEDGTTLSSNEYLSFSTEYDPFYCSTDMLLMELGPWAESIPEETLALAIHWSSMEADYITCKKPVNDRHTYALTRFVMYDAAIRLLTMPTGTSGPSGSRKELGDLLIESGQLDINIKDLLAELKLERDEWWRVVNAGGTIVPGQGLGPTFATKGGASKDPKISREWHDPWNTYYTQPSANSKYRKPGEKKYKSGFTRWSEHYITSVTKGPRR